MRRILPCALSLLLLLLPSLTLAATPIDISELPAADLLALWQAAADRLRQLDAYPYIELSKGDAGSDVTAVQHRLQSLYFYTADLTGKYDAATVKAVKAWEKAQGYKADGKLTIDEQDVLFSDTAAVKATPTPQPSPTLAPTPVPDHAALEIIGITVKDAYNIKTLSLKLRNHSQATIDAFSIVFKAYNAYGERTKDLWGQETIETAEWWKALSIKPGKTFSMGSYYWYLDDQTTASVEVAISKYHTTEGTTITIPEADYIWILGK